MLRLWNFECIIYCFVKTWWPLLTTVLSQDLQWGFWRGVWYCQPAMTMVRDSLLFIKSPNDQCLGTGMRIDFPSRFWSPRLISCIQNVFRVLCTCLSSHLVRHIEYLCNVSESSKPMSKERISSHVKLVSDVSYICVEKTSCQTVLDHSFDMHALLSMFALRNTNPDGSVLIPQRNTICYIVSTFKLSVFIQ